MTQEPKTLHLAVQRLEEKIADFSQGAAELFKHNQWRWSGYCNGVPQSTDIEDNIRDLLYKAEREITQSGQDHACLSAGRLQVRLNKYASGWTGSLEVCPLYTFTG